MPDNPSVDTEEEVRFQGIPVSGGIVRGSVRLRGKQFDIPAYREISPSEVEKEVQRLKQTIQLTKEQLEKLLVQVADGIGKEEAYIFEAHLLVLEDRSILDEVEERIKNECVGAEVVYYVVMTRYVETLRAVEDSYLAERATDIEDVISRVVQNLSGSSVGQGGFQAPHIVIAPDLTPSDTAEMVPGTVLGFATDFGSPTAHTAIIARSLDIPAVVGLHDISSRVQGGDELLIDGYNGLVILRPSPATLAFYEKLSSEKAVLREKVRSQQNAETKTSDGSSITLSANVEFTHELPAVRGNGAQGIGLYRTEFLFLGGKEPSEEEQFKTYSAAVQGVSPDPVIFRTLDIGGDKLPGGKAASEPEPNPFLGCRGIRISLRRRNMFKAQLRALLKASSMGNIGIMYPMVSGINEVKKANEILEECKRELDESNIPYSSNIEVGVMIEVPSAAITANTIAQEVDFFSIGSNDLIQYTVAVDRINETVADLYQSTHPAVISLIQMAVDAAHSNNIWAGVCGEIAADLRLTPLLIGLGIDELSVAAAHVPRVKYAIRLLDRADCKEWVKNILTLDDAESILEACVEKANLHYSEFLS